MLTIERDPSFREDVRNRFDWTLDLDDRYKVITYGLVLSESPTTAKTAKEFEELGSSWWAGVFDRLEAQDMRALLDEMVGLGVLLAEHHEDLSRQYRLRSPNLLRLLGPKETIEGELLRICINRPNDSPQPSRFSQPFGRNRSVRSTYQGARRIPIRNKRTLLFGFDPWHNSYGITPGRHAGSTGHAIYRRRYGCPVGKKSQFRLLVA